MSDLYGSMTNLDGFSDGIFDLVKRYVNPNMEKESETSMVFFSCFTALEDYFSNNGNGLGFDSESSELVDLQNFKNEIRGIVRNYQGDDFDENCTDIDCLNKVREIISHTSALEKENKAFIDGLKNLYMQEDGANA